MSEISAGHVFVLTTGDYSDYRIVGAFTSAEKATKFAVDIGLEEDCTVEFYQLNPTKYHPGSNMVLWEIDILRDGTTTSAYDWKNPPEEESAWQKEEVELRHYADRRGSSTSLHVVKWVRSREHIVKIANDLRLQLIATGGWPGEWK